MLYQQYKNVKDKYIRALEKYNELIDRKERAFLKSQNITINYSSESSSNNQSSVEEIYVETIDKLDADIKIAKDIYESRKLLLEEKEKELRKSKNWYDILYTALYIDCKSMRSIIRTFPYSRRQIYNIKNKFEKNYLKK